MLRRDAVRGDGEGRPSEGVVLGRLGLGEVAGGDRAREDAAFRVADVGCRRGRPLPVPGLRLRRDASERVVGEDGARSVRGGFGKESFARVLALDPRAVGGDLQDRVPEVVAGGRGPGDALEVVFPRPRADVGLPEDHEARRADLDRNLAHGAAGDLGGTARERPRRPPRRHGAEVLLVLGVRGEDSGGAALPRLVGPGDVVALVHRPVRRDAEREPLRAGAAGVLRHVVGIRPVVRRVRPGGGRVSRRRPEEPHLLDNAVAPRVQRREAQRPRDRDAADGLGLVTRQTHVLGAVVVGYGRDAGWRVRAHPDGVVRHRAHTHRAARGADGLADHAPGKVVLPLGDEARRLRARGEAARERRARAAVGAGLDVGGAGGAVLGDSHWLLHAGGVLVVDGTERLEAARAGDAPLDPAKTVRKRGDRALGDMQTAAARNRIDGPAGGL